MTVRIDGATSEYKSTRRGIRQGGILSPDLFNIYSEMIMREISDLEGMKVGGVNINNLGYVDDIVLIVDSQGKPQTILDRVVTTSQDKGLSLNVKKIVCLMASKKKTTTRCILHIKEERIKEVGNVKYLGFTITADGKSDAEVKRRIAMAKRFIYKIRLSF